MVQRNRRYGGWLRHNRHVLDPVLRGGTMDAPESHGEYRAELQQVVKGGRVLNWKRHAAEGWAYHVCGDIRPDGEFKGIDAVHRSEAGGFEFRLRKMRLGIDPCEEP